MKARIIGLAAVLFFAISCGDGNRAYVRKAVRIMDKNGIYADGAQLVLTTGCDVARTGEVFCDDPIVPDVLTSCPLEEAVEWIRAQI